MKNISSVLKENKVKPMVYGEWSLEIDSDSCDMEEHSRFQRDTHYNLEINPFNYSYDVLPLENVNNSDKK